MQKIIVPILILVLLSLSVFAQVAPSSDTAIMNQLNEQLSRNKAEIIKAVNDGNLRSQNATSAFIDENFAALDKRIQDMNQSQKRDIAIIMVAGFLVAFALSQIIRLSIERARRRALINHGMELEIAVQRLEKDAGEMAVRVKQLKALDAKYSESLKKMGKKEPFISFRMAWFGLITLLLGCLLTYFLMGGK
jgi:hypothetical protein